MALIECPECGKMVSDKAEICVNCGYPIREMAIETDEQVVDYEDLSAEELYANACALMDYDIDQALDLLEKAGNMGCQRAWIVLSNYYCDIDSYKATQYTLKGAEAGNAQAQYIIGSNYFYGIDLPKDYNQAIYWYNKAIENDSTEAMVDLGIMYSLGKGVMENQQKALKYFLMASDAGSPKGMYYVALMYLGGKYCRKDKNKAIDLLIESAKNGCEEAIEMLGELNQ